MYQRKSRRCCAWMLIVSTCLRLCMLLGLDTRAMTLLTQAAAKPETGKLLLFLETGRILDIEPPPPEVRVSVLRVEEPQPRPETVSMPMEVHMVPDPALPEALADAEEIPVAGACTYSYDKADLLDRPSAMDLTGDGPKVLIVHTHGTEAYTPTAEQPYEAITDYRTLEADRSVIAVGAELARTLEAGGISVLHDTSVNDYPSYNDSYWTTLSRIQGWLEQYPGIQMVIDLHRDGVEDADGGAVALSCTQQGQQAARLMLVVGTDQGGLAHPDWQENLANGLKLQSVLEGAYPGLCRSLDLRTERFNQHMTPGSLLVEVGSNGNTLSEALTSARLLGDGLCRMLHALEQNGGTLQNG